MAESLLPFRDGFYAGAVNVELAAMDPVDPLVVEGLDAWRYLDAAQQPHWPDPAALAAAVAELSSFPPLVFAGECDNLRQRLAAAGAGRGVRPAGRRLRRDLRRCDGGQDPQPDQDVLQMAVVLTYGGSRPGGQGRPDGRAVRQAAQQRRRDPRAA